MARRPVRPLGIALVALIAAAATRVPGASGEVVMVYAVTRHGARNVLPKSATLQESEATGGPTLLPQGIQGSTAAGAAFRDRYLAHPSCARDFTCLSAPGREAYGLVTSPGAGFSNYDTLARSSTLDRTLRSAAAFLSGAFPPGAAAPGGLAEAVVSQLPPVYSVADSEDWVVRAYTKCPAYQSRLEAWFASPEFAAKQEETRALREGITAAAPGLNVALENWWNVFDAFNVWRKYGVGDVMPNITDSEFKQVAELADWLETAKMRSNLTGNGLGGGLLGDLIARLQAASEHLREGKAAGFYRLLLTSAHYNTQLALLAAMGLDTALTSRQLPWLGNLPATSSVLLFELHQGGPMTGGALAVRMVIQDGPSKPYVPVPLPCAAGEGGDPGAAEAFAGPGACELGAFLRAFKGVAIQNAADWCNACANGATNVCVAARAKSAGAARTGADGGDSGGLKVAVGVLAGALTLAVVAAAVAILMLRRAKHEDAKSPLQQGTATTI